MSLNKSYDIGRQLVAAVGVAPTVTPSSSGAATNGPTIDRWAYQRRYYSAKSIGRGLFSGSTQGAAALAASFQHSSDGTSWDNYSTASNASKAFGSTGTTGSNTGVNDVVEQAVSLVGARRYIRQVLTPTFAGGTSGDTLTFSGVVVLGGADEQPST